MGMETKRCPKCGATTGFGLDRSRSDGLSVYCLTCKAKQMRDFRKTHTLTPEQQFKDNARSYAYVYFKRGKLIKPKACERCSVIAPLQMHHHDYTKPLEIEWLCKDCHKLEYAPQAVRKRPTHPAYFDLEGLIRAFSLIIKAKRRRKP